MTNLKHRLARHFAVAAVATASVTSADASVVYSGVVNHYVPDSLNGMYLNVVTGQINRTNQSGSTVPGWDLNFWSPNGLGIHSNAQQPGNGVLLSAAETGANLDLDAVIDAGGVFGDNASFNTSQWNLDSEDNLFGFRFHHEGTGAVHYGWGRIGFGATIFDRYLVEYAFEGRPGVGIAASSLVPAPSALAMLGLGGVVAGRRRR